MNVMREILNAEQTQVHPCNPSQGWLRRLSSIALSPPGRIVAYRINDPWLSCRLEANALIEQGCEPASDIGPVKRPRIPKCHWPISREQTSERIVAIWDNDPRARLPTRIVNDKGRYHSLPGGKKRGSSRLCRPFLADPNPVRLTRSRKSPLLD